MWRNVLKNKIYYNGIILTLEDENYPECVKVQDGKIVEMGKFADIKQDQYTELVDLNGHCLMPSFIDTHSHITAYAQILGVVRLNEVTSFEELQQAIAKFKRENAVGDSEWIIGFGYDHNFLEEKSHPTRKELDEVSRTNPIIITHTSGHMGVLNSRALELVGIKEEMEKFAGISLEKDETGRITGYLEETAFMQVSKKVPQPSFEATANLLIQAQNHYLKYGITTIQDGLVKEENFKLLDYAAQHHLLKTDIVGYIDMKNNPELLQQHPEYLKNYNHHLKLGGYKLILDGSPQGKTAWLSIPYLGSGTDCGYPIYTNQEVEVFIRTALKERQQLLTHCNGDAASEQLLDSFEGVVAKYKFQDTIRPVMIHAQTVRLDQLKRMKSFSMIPSFFVGHTYYWGDIHLQNLGKTRAEKISPIQSAIKAGLIYTLHQDTPVTEPDMWHSIWCAVNRQTKNGITLGESEKISVLEAIKGVTLYAAYSYFEEEEKGSIKVGKLADFIIVDENPLIVASEKLKDIQILETIKQGNTLYRK